MPRNKYIVSPVKEAIARARERGVKVMQVAKDFNVGKSTVSDIHKRWIEKKSVARLPKSGRPRKTTKKQDRSLIRVVKIDPRKTAVDVMKHANSSLGLNITDRTARNILKRAGLNARRPARKPLISKKNRKARLEFARRYQTWTPGDWAKVLFSDESKFNLFSSDGIRYVRRPVGKRNDVRYQVPTVKHGGGSVMVWGKCSIFQNLKFLKFCGIFMMLFARHDRSHCPRGGHNECCEVSCDPRGAYAATF